MLHPIPTGSVTGNIRRAQSGDEIAFEWLWHRYYKSLVRHLQRRACGNGYLPVDPEDVAQNVFLALHDGLTNAQFHSLHGRFQLWKLLTLIGLRKAINLAKKDRLNRDYYQFAQSTGLPISDQRSVHRSCTTGVVESFEALKFDEELEHGLSLLKNENPSHRLQELAILKMKGYCNAKIAQEFGWSRKTVALRLNLIYEIWKKASEDES
jgi:DNA-directed RNA polymerase specialized sigma24 family protein